jgi:hypothetical protein
MNKHLKTARSIANMMDNQFKVFGIGFGLDNILGLFPGFGDFATLLLSGYLVWIGYQMGLPTPKLLQMISNVLLDTVIGSVPVLGDIGDLFFKANLKNLQILEEFEGVIEGEVVH